MKLDNQQRRLEDDLNWLGGIIDGEGSVTATVGHTKTGKGHVYEHRRYIPLIHIVNTDKGLISEIKRVLEEMEIPCYINVRSGSKKNPHWKMKTEFMVVGMKRCLNACNKLLPYLRSEKKDRMEAMKEWIEYRLASPKIPFSTKGYGGLKQAYTDVDWELLKRIRQSSLPLRGHTSSSTNKVDEDMVQYTAKAA